jgi:hypothetical protein
MGKGQGEGGREGREKKQKMELRLFFLRPLCLPTVQMEVHVSEQRDAESRLQTDYMD